MENQGIFALNIFSDCATGINRFLHIVFDVKIGQVIAIRIGENLTEIEVKCFANNQAGRYFIRSAFDSCGNLVVCNSHGNPIDFGIFKTVIGFQLNCMRSGGIRRIAVGRRNRSPLRKCSVRLLNSRQIGQRIAIGVHIKQIRAVHRPFMTFNRVHGRFIALSLERRRRIHLQLIIQRRRGRRASRLCIDADLHQCILRNGSSCYAVDTIVLRNRCAL